MIGGAILYWFGANQYEPTRQFLLTVPLVSENMLTIAGSHLRDHGMYGMVIGSGQGIPYKIYATLCGQFHSDFWIFLLATIPARALRMALSIIVCSGIATLYRKCFRHYDRHLLITFVIVWISIYSAYTYKVLHVYF